jgi:uncharacterized protein DUF4157
VASNQGSSGSGRFRNLIPFFRRKPERAPIATSGLAVRPPWWRMAVRRMVTGLWPGFRAGQSAEYGDARPSARAGQASKPLLARRQSLASRASVLPRRKTAAPRSIVGPKTLTAPAKDTVAPLGHTSAANLPVASMMGRASLAAQQQDSAHVEYAADEVSAAASQQVVIQRESARMSLPSAPASLSRPPALTAQRTTTRPAKTQQVTSSQAKPLSLATPEQRWRQAVAAVPLESPRPFPTSMRPLVAQLAGSADRVSYTAGPATRRALTEVGALGATTGTVVHLSQQPGSEASMGVLAHELTHARSPISRPRFMLHSPTGSMDADERQARSVGDQFNDVSASPSMSSGPPPMMVQRLFGGGGSSMMDGLTNRATGALGGLGGQATNAISGLGNQATSALGSGANAVTGGIGNAASALSDRFSSAAGDLGNSVADQAGAVSAGLVDQLPVGGGAAGTVGAISQVARSAVENAVRQATATTVAEASNAVGQMSQAAQGMAGDLQGMASGAVNDATGQASQWVNGAVSQASGAVQGVGDDASAAVGDAENAVAGGANGLMNKAMGALGAGPGAAPQMSGQDLDRIAEALEERLLRQLERRGGRYAGVF